MTILSQTKFKYSKPLKILLAILITLSPIVSSAGALFSGETFSGEKNVIDVLMSDSSRSHLSAFELNSMGDEQMKTSMDCHKSTAQNLLSSSNVISNGSANHDCCDEPCLCAQAGCQSSAAAFDNSVLSMSIDQSVFSFTSSLYLNPQSSPTFPPPIS